MTNPRARLGHVWILCLVLSLLYGQSVKGAQPDKEIDRLARAYRAARTEFERRAVCLDADYMTRRQLCCDAGREGEDVCYPVQGIFGPKAMIIDEFARSGGDALPWYFRKMGIGPLVGKRTWGGLVAYDVSELMDGRVTSPSRGTYGLSGEWEIENRGVAPDYEVELDPKALAEGHDLQLERAVKLVMDELAKHPLPKYKRPPYPDYHQQIKARNGGK